MRSKFDQCSDSELSQQLNHFEKAPAIPGSRYAGIRNRSIDELRAELNRRAGL